METSYKRSMNRNYIILKEEGIKEAKGYQTAILLENIVPGLLPCYLQKVNGEALFYYETTGYQNLQCLFEKNKMRKKEVTRLFLSIGKLLDSLNEYLLNGDSLLLDFKYIYQNTETGKLGFLYFPFAFQESGEQLRILAEYILPKLDYEDKEAVSIGYAFYKESMRKNMTEDVIKNCIYNIQTEEQEETEKAAAIKSRGESTSDYVRVSADFEEEKKRQKLLDDFYREDETENAENYKGIYLVGIVLGLAVLCFLLYHFRLLPFYGALGAGGILCAALIAGIFFLIRKGEQEKKEVLCETEACEAGEDQAYFPQTDVTSDHLSAEEEGLTTVLTQEKGRGEPYLEQTETLERKVFPEKKENILIGKRRNSVDIWIDDSTVSRIHGKIRRSEEGDYLIDLNSRNGTLLNQEYLDPEREYPIKNGDIIQFSRVKFCYIIPE